MNVKNDRAPTIYDLEANNKQTAHNLALEELLQKQPTSLQKHIGFFNRLPADNKISVSETYEGLRSLGMNPITAALAALFINVSLGFKTSGRWGLDVDIAKIALGMHGGDSGVIDKQGNFNESAFNDMFINYDADKDDALSSSEIATMQAQRGAKGFAEKVQTKGEFGLLMMLASDGTNRQGEKTLSRDRLRSLYDGSLFYKLEAETRAQDAAERAEQIRFWGPKIPREGA